MISCKTQMIRNDQLESDTKRMQATCCKLQGSPRRSRTQMGATAGCIGSILTLPKFHLATSNFFSKCLICNVQNVPNECWQITRINEKYDFCETYPGLVSHH